MPGVLGVVLWPEEGEQGVTTMEAAGGGEGQVAKQGSASRLRDDGSGVAVSRGELQGT
jgi:hypothetical protein